MKLLRKELLDFIYEKEIVKDDSYNFRKMINRHNKQVISDNIDHHVKNCQGNRLIEKIYWLVNSLTAYPKKCLHCYKNITLFGEWKDPYYNTYCSSKCSAACKIRKNKVIKTNIERYGSPNAFGSSVIKEKIKNTLLDRYGVDQTFKIPGLMNKIKKTNLERYGVEYTFQVDEFRNKTKITNIKKYGVEYTLQSDEIKDKIKATNIERYGVEYISQSKKFKDKLKASNLKKFYYNLSCRTDDKVTPSFSISEYKGINHLYEWKCNVCDNVIWSNLMYGRIPICKTCYPFNMSNGERQVKEFLKLLNINIIGNDRTIIKPKELDIIIPEQKIAIEYNGLYWHGNNAGKTKEYHSNKFKQAGKQGYRLIAIFEDEWINKQEICKDRLKHILGINDTTCYARQTIIKEISNNEHRDFLITYHIQGFIDAKIKLGAFYKDELVAVMTFGKKRRALGNKIQKDNSYELLRFCVKGSIPGVGSKLFKYFTRNYKPNEIISYCDLRWGTGLFYEKLGFKLSHISEPNYWYFRNQLIRQHRYQFRKQSLIEMNSYSPEKTEWQIMQEEGYDKIYDCGNKVFKWIK